MPDFLGLVDPPKIKFLKGLIDDIIDFILHFDALILFLSGSCRCIVMEQIIVMCLLSYLLQQPLIVSLVLDLPLQLLLLHQHVHHQLVLVGEGEEDVDEVWFVAEGSE